MSIPNLKVRHPKTLKKSETFDHYASTQESCAFQSSYFHIRDVQCVL